MRLPPPERPSKWLAPLASNRRSVSLRHGCNYIAAGVRTVFLPAGPGRASHFDDPFGPPHALTANVSENGASEAESARPAQQNNIAARRTASAAPRFLLTSDSDSCMVLGMDCM